MMRWISFAILMFAALIVQLGISGIFSFGGEKGSLSPDLLLALGVVICFRNNKEQSMVACWILGLMKDLTGQTQLGFYAFSFGIAAWILVQIRDFLYGENPITIIVITFLTALFVEQIVIIVSLIKGTFPLDQYSRLTMITLLSSLLTAPAGPIFYWISKKFYRQLGLPMRRGYAR